MATFRQLTPSIDFKMDPSVVVEFNPDAEIRELESGDRKYPAVVVVRDGKPWMLPVGSNRLVSKLKQFEKPVKLKITRLPGAQSNFDTDYNVEEVPGGAKKAQVA